MNSETMGYNVLRTSIIRTKTRSSGVQFLSLPEILGALALDDVESFPALRPHQRFVWHAFLVQLAALALKQSGKDSPIISPDGWIALLRGLTPEYADDAPWHLVTPPDKPALLQAPVTNGGLAGFNDIQTPSELDTVLPGITRNHDQKLHNLADGQVDDWLFSLVSVQTQSAYMLKYPGVARMAGNFGTRTCFAFRPSGGLGNWFVRDVTIAVEIPDNSKWPSQKYGLTWLLPWDGKQSLDISALPALFIEICQRVRIIVNNDRLRAVRKADAKPRVGTKAQRDALRGVLSDPWLPVQIAAKHKDTDLPRAASVRAKGIPYDTILNWLDGKYFIKPPNFRFLPEDKSSEMELFACSVARRGDRSVTLGYRERSIPTPAAIINAFGQHASDVIGEVGKSRANDIATLVSEILRPALLCLLREGRTDERLSQKPLENFRARTDLWVTRLEHEVDGVFFDELWKELEAPAETGDAVRKAWLTHWIRRARSLLEEAGRSMPLAAIHRYRARAEALRVFDDRKRRNDAFAFIFRAESADE